MVKIGGLLMKLNKTLGSSISINGCTPDEVIAKMITIKEKYRGWDMTIDVEYVGYDFDIEGTKVETQEEERLIEVKFEGFDHE